MYMYTYVYFQVVRVLCKSSFTMVFPLKYRLFFFPKRAFHGEGDSWGNLRRVVVVLTGTIDQIMPREGGSFIDAFFNNLITLKLFPNHIRVFT